MKQWDRFEYRLFRDDDAISIRKIYYSDDIPQAYSNPVGKFCQLVEFIKNIY
jgi:hypothetical protein